MIPSTSTNLRNRVKKLYLPKTKALYPLFELISNSIHAIQENEEQLKKNNAKGEIRIELIRIGNEEAINQANDLDIYPVHSFVVTDNGIGLNKSNFTSFTEFDSEKKAEIGGKGVGRLVCLKAFRLLNIRSVYQENGHFRERSFKYKRTKEGFEDYSDDVKSTGKYSETRIELFEFENYYQKHAPTSMLEIARQILAHFQLYFIQGIEPEIILIDQINNTINLTRLFRDEFVREILFQDFTVANQKFKVFISKSFKARSHRIHYCAHQRSVKDEGLSKYIVDLKNKVKEDKEAQGYYFQVFIVGDFLDQNVNESRAGFNFSTGEDAGDVGEIEVEDITLNKIRKESINAIEALLSDLLTDIRKEKLDTYYPIIEEEYPNYHSVIHYNGDEVSKLPPGLNRDELDLKLYEIESQWRVRVKREGIRLIDEKSDITELEDYKELYSKFLTEFNEIGQADLARYIVHRRSVIDLLQRLIRLNEAQKFANEDIVHSLFFPIRESRNSVSLEKQNLWLIDERLTFNTLLASDKLFKQVDELESDSAMRMDIVVRQGEVFENAALFAEEKIPFESFTIVEFKRPERDDYKHGDRKKDPVKQVRTYVEEIITGEAKVHGKKVNATNTTPFYCYIIADITDSLQYILDYENFDPTPDGMGYFKFYDTKKSKAYIEVVPFEKIIKDAKQRNKILFDKLKLS